MQPGVMLPVSLMGRGEMVRYDAMSRMGLRDEVAC